MMKRVMIVAGETSGDLHGSGVVRELRRLVPGVEVFGIGGDAMQAEGMECVHHVSGLSFMGFVEVLKNLPLIRRVEADLTALLDTRRPDVVVLIDYPGFNLRFARAVKRRDIKVVYYISPQVWAWHRSRLRRMKGLVDRMAVVFPFEVELYRREGIDVEFVGHPLAERIGSQTTDTEFRRWAGIPAGPKLLALLPGSRKQEIERIFPAMAGAARLVHEQTGAEIAASVAPHLSRELLSMHVPAGLQVHYIQGRTYELMRHADAALVTSGTATLETGWFGTPLAVVYRTSPLTYLIGRMLVRVKSIGLVNIVAGEPVVPEFIQSAVQPRTLAAEMTRILRDESYAGAMRTRLAVIRERLGEAGASARVARSVATLAGAS